MEKDRKTRIADGAIHLLGTEGARALTHRGVDVVAGLPVGSTSFYCRTKAELLSLALLRHAALDMADLAADQQHLVGITVTRELVVEQVLQRVADWSSPAKRIQLVARFELFLMASREPDLAVILSQQRQRFLVFTENMLRSIEMPHAHHRAMALMITVDGLLLDQVRGDSPPFAPDHLRAWLKALLSS